MENKDIADMLGLDIEALNTLLRSEELRDAKEAYDTAPEGSDTEKLAMEKWLSLVTDVQVAKEIYSDTPSDSDVEKLALVKWKKLSLAQIESSTTAEEAREAYANTPSDSDVEKLALEKWLSLVTTTQEAREAYIVAPSDAMKIAIVRLMQNM